MAIAEVVIVLVVGYVSLGSATGIAGGVNSDKGEFPFVVSLQLFGFHYCAGSVLSDRWVLTAARCAMPFEVGVVAGMHDLDGVESSQQSAAANITLLHPSYNPDAEGSPSIALLKLESPLTLNEWVQPIKIPVAGETATGNATLVGWGRTSTANLAETLQKVEVPVLTDGECGAALSGLNDTNTEMCTGPLTGGSSVCTGDSGDPLSQEDASGNRVLVGVASSPVDPCGRTGAPSVYAKVSAYSEWIASTMLHN